MEDDLKKNENGRQPQTKMEDNLKKKGGSLPQKINKMEDDLKHNLKKQS